MYLLSAVHVTIVYIFQATSASQTTSSTKLQILQNYLPVSISSPNERRKNITASSATKVAHAHTNEKTHGGWHADDPNFGLLQNHMKRGGLLQSHWSAVRSEQADQDQAGERRDAEHYEIPDGRQGPDTDGDFGYNAPADRTAIERSSGSKETESPQNVTANLCEDSEHHFGNTCYSITRKVMGFEAWLECKKKGRGTKLALLQTSEQYNVAKWLYNKQDLYFFVDYIDNDTFRDDMNNNPWQDPVINKVCKQNDYGFECKCVVLRPPLNVLFYRICELAEYRAVCERPMNHAEREA